MQNESIRHDVAGRIAAKWSVYHATADGSGPREPWPGGGGAPGDGVRDPGYMSRKKSKV